MEESENTKVLLVEDDPQLRSLVFSTLQQQGFEVSSAASGEEALCLIDVQKFDVILSDFAMPNGDGLWLLKRVKELSSAIPFILTTGNGDISEESVKDAGGFGLLRKPVEPQDYLAMIDAALK